MNKGSRMTSGKTDIEKGITSPTNRQYRKSTAGKQQKKMRTWMCAQRHYRKKKTQDTISGNGQRWETRS